MGPVAKSFLYDLVLAGAAAAVFFATSGEVRKVAFVVLMVTVLTVPFTVAQHWWSKRQRRAAP